MPCVASDRIADSRPLPIPFTKMKTRETPNAFAFSASASATRDAANGVDFLDPVNPIDPEETQARTLPRSSQSESITLLYEART